MRIIATRTDTSWGLVEEQEFISLDNELKAIFLEFGWAKPYDDTLPLPPKGLNDYEPGLSYPNGRKIIKDNAMWESSVGLGNYTSRTWVPAEWTLKLKGAL